MMSINAVADWVTDAKKGDQATYYTGWLIGDRGFHGVSELAKIANYVWSMQERGLIYLAQKKTPNCTKNYAEYEYIMQRSSKDRI
jgi:hypothetical protein